MKNSFKNWFKSKNIPDEIRVLKYVVVKGGIVSLEKITEALNIEKETVFCLQQGDTKYLIDDLKGNKKIVADGKFKLIEWENLQAARRQFWVSIAVAIVAMLISIGGIIWDSKSDEVWQQQQTELLQQQNNLLEKLIEREQ